MRLVADIETDGFLHSLTKIHCLVLRERSGELVLSCTDDPRGRKLGYASITEGLKLMAEADKIYLHNGIGFDIPAIQKVYPGWTYSGELIDTLVVAAFRFAHIKDQDFKRAREGSFPTHLAGRHSLEAWGVRLGCHKGEYTSWCKENGIEDPWAEWSPEMQTYCEGDTEVTNVLADHLGKHGIPPVASRIEHELAWYLAQQERNGWPIDRPKLVDLIATLSARREILSAKLRKEFGWWYKQNRKPVVPKRTMQYQKDRRLVVEGAPYTPLEVVEFNPNSRQHIEKVLRERYGWNPKDFTPSGQAKLDEKVLKGLERVGCSADLIEFLLVQKRLGQVAEGDQAWVDHLRPNAATGMEHIHGRVWQNSCVTHRASHTNPNTAQVPKVGSPYGEECRAVWTVPSGWVQIGADASGLELRCLAHYMAQWDGGAYGKTILEGRNEDGTDIHSVNRDALRATEYPDKKVQALIAELSRGSAKNWIYAYLYGAGDEKLGAMAVPLPKHYKRLGRLLRTGFEQKIPALGALQKAVKGKVSQGYVIMPDGRKTYIRHEHAALNSLLQAAGAIICKAWIAEFNRRLCERFGSRPGGGWDQEWAALGWIHDEVQIACRPEHTEEVSEIIVDSIRSITALFNWRIPLDGEAKVGGSWAECH